MRMLVGGRGGGGVVVVMVVVGLKWKDGRGEERKHPVRSDSVLV